MIDEQNNTVYQVAPPHNREAEEGVLASVLIEPTVFHACRVHISSQDEFYVHRHGFIWAAYEKMFAEGTPVDLVTLTDELDNLGTLHEIGGPAYLTAMLSQFPSAINAQAYAKIVHEHYTRRKIISAANEIATLGYDEQRSLGDVSSEATHALSQAVASSTNAHSHHISESLIRIDALIEERGKSLEDPGIPTGLVDLDRILGGGAQDSDLWLIAARPGEGKTSLLLQFMRNAACYKTNLKIHKKRVALFSLEMPEEQIVLRMLSQISGIDFQLLRSGRFPQHQQQTYLNALDELGQLDIVIDDTRGVSPAYIRSRCEILHAEKELDAVFVDSLNLFKSGLNFGKRTDREVDYNATELSNLAGEFNIPIWCSHQMNRGIEQRGMNSRPILSDLREGGEQPANGVLFIHHEYDKDNLKKINSSELVVAKQRNGPTDHIAVVFLGAHTTFKSAYRIPGQE